MEALLLPEDTYVEVVTLPEAKDEPVEVPVGAVVAVDVSKNQLHLKKWGSCSPYCSKSYKSFNRLLKHFFYSNCK